MHGVPQDLDLSAFVGREVIQVALGPHDVQLNLHPSGSISIEGRLELYQDTGDLIEAGAPNEVTPSTSLGALIGCIIAEAIPEPPSAVRFRFGSGYVLRLIDDSDSCESFVLHPGPIVA